MGKHIARSIRHLKTGILFLFFILSCFLSGCEQVWESDRPVSAERAQEISEINLSLPKFARKVEFRVSGETQSWTFYVSYEASPEDIKTAIRKELLHTADPARGLPAEDYQELPLPKRESWWERMLSGYPSWWKPEDIKEGFFVCSPSGGNEGPMWWVDTGKGRVYYYTHSN